MLPETSEPIPSRVTSVPRKIAFCITDLDPGGAEKALVQIVTRLNREEWEPRVYCLGPEAALVSQLRGQGITTLCYGGRRWWDLRVLFWLANELRQFRPALLQCFLFHANLAGRLSGGMAGVPMVLAGHRVAEREKHWHLWLERLTKCLVTHHVCVSQGVAEHLMQSTGVGSERISVIPNGVAVPVFRDTAVNLRQEQDWPLESLVVIAVGRLHPQKGFSDLVQVFSAVVRKRPLARLLIVGEGPERGRLEGLIRSLGMQGVISLAGYRTDVPDLMRQSQILAVSSHWEGMSNVLLEALAVGLPVVTRPVEGVTDLLERFPTEICVTRDLETGLESALEKRSPPEFRSEMVGDVSQPVSGQLLTWDWVSAQYAHLYRGLLAMSGRKGKT